MSDNLFAFFRSRFPQDPSHPFLEEPGGRSLSYGDIERETGRLANLFSDLGVAAGDRIVVHTEKTSENLLVYLASLRCGAIYVPLNSAYTLSEVRYFIEDAEPALVICRPQDEASFRADLLEPRGPRLLTLGPEGEGTVVEQAREKATNFADAARASDDIAAILYTSGTTGRSKGAMLTHENLRSNCDTLSSLWRFTPGDRLLHALPVFHTHGLFVATNVTLASGSSMIFLPRFDVRELIKWMPAATVLMGVPTFYVRLLGEGDFTSDLTAHMRLFISGSAPLSAETHKDFAARTGRAILERYGMTETNMNTSNPYDGDRLPGSVGLPLPGVDLRLTDPATGVPIMDGVGSIEVRGPNVFKGYWRNPDKTAEDFRADGFFITGDLGKVDERGYVHIVGRAKDLIISGGFNIYPAEVEMALEAVDGVAECAIIGVPHRDMGEAVVAVVKLAPSRVMAEADIIAAIAGDLARFKQPRRVEFVDELPRNAMGKVQKRDLRIAYAGLFT